MLISFSEKHRSYFFITLVSYCNCPKSVFELCISKHKKIKIGLIVESYEMKKYLSITNELIYLLLFDESHVNFLKLYVNVNLNKLCQNQLEWNHFWMIFFYTDPRRLNAKLTSIALLKSCFSSVSPHFIILVLLLRFRYSNNKAC